MNKIFDNKRHVIFFTITTVVILGILLLFSITGHNVTPTEVRANLGITQGDTLDIQKLDIKKSETSLYEVGYSMRLHKDTADRLRDNSSPFYSCNIKNCTVSDWGELQSVGKSESSLKRPIYCTIRSIISEDGRHRERQDVFCLGAGNDATYRVDIPHALGPSFW